MMFLSRPIAPLLLMGALALSSCEHGDMYSLRAAYEEALPRAAVQELPKGRTAPVLYVQDVTAAVERYKAAGYEVVGKIHWKAAELTSYRAISALAEEKGASVVLANETYVGTEVTETSFTVQDTVTTRLGIPADTSVPGNSSSCSYSTSSTALYASVPAFISYKARYRQTYFFLAPRA